MALPTPPGEDGSADLSYVLNVADQLGEMMTEFKVIVDKSTVPVGTAEKVEAKIREKATVDFAVVSNPEFLREGSAINDFMHPDRIVIGCENKKSENIMRELYRPLYLLETPIVSTNVESAEIIKYVGDLSIKKIIYIKGKLVNIVAS